MQIFGLGFTSVFDQVLGGLPAEQSKKLFKAYLNALDEDPDQYRSDAEQMNKWAAEKKGAPAPQDIPVLKSAACSCFNDALSFESCMCHPCPASDIQILNGFMRRGKLARGLC